jgi:uncharacterized membrane protein YeaQ/YmgE (transglycosylase-associated protein family)
MSLLLWIITGIIAGWLAGMIVSGGGYGLIGDLVLGLVGGVIGGWLFSLLGLNPGPSNIIGQIAVAAAGAIVLVLALRAVRRAT